MICKRCGNETNNHTLAVMLLVDETGKTLDKATCPEPELPCCRDCFAKARNIAIELTKLDTRCKNELQGFDLTTKDGLIGSLTLYAKYNLEQFNIRKKYK